MNALPPPQTMDDFRERLLAIADTLPRRLRQCADLVARAPERIAVSTVAELAAAADVPPSAFVRFCQLFGFSGFSEMQKLFREAHAPRWPDYATRLESLRRQGHDSPSALLAEFVEAGRHSLADLANALDNAALDEAVEVLAQARTIHLVGFRRVFPVVSYMAYALEKMEIPAVLHGAVGHFDTRHAMLEGDALVAVTFAPYTPATVDLAAYAAERGLPVVAITDTMTSPLWRVKATRLSVAEVDVGAFRALAATLSLATALVVATGARRGRLEQ
ncbi:MurR/RpiR family transcriptional regulator [Aureimonas frigidaquae]|uniref:Transcriptional regulator RpiR family protein n=1 Tax=Aureimonas frigidaquae TaxID=424757 RepID=A0A0N7KXS6_9HYPH|nr:MurR/RpiR family transcriptional regulator [Aureimonas frigidaquae]BAT27745.1 transcriptional regulator RpiR family protein [Aureimonas frigidaquae]